MLLYALIYTVVLFSHRTVQFDMVHNVLENMFQCLIYHLHFDIACSCSSQ